MFCQFCPTSNTRNLVSEPLRSSTQNVEIIRYDLYIVIYEAESLLRNSKRAVMNKVSKTLNIPKDRFQNEKRFLSPGFHLKAKVGNLSINVWKKITLLNRSDKIIIMRVRIGHRKLTRSHFTPQNPQTNVLIL